MIGAEMTDAEVCQQVDRADRFIAAFREMVAATVVDPASACADYQRRGLARIASTLDAVPYVTFCNLANINAAMRGGLLAVIEVQLMCVGAGPTLDYIHGADAAAQLTTHAIGARPGTGQAKLIRATVPRKNGRVPAGDRHGADAAAQLTTHAIGARPGTGQAKLIRATVPRKNSASFIAKRARSALFPENKVGAG